MHKAQRLINHVALVLDGSSSMRGHSSNLVKVADEQIQYLALRSEELSQETRVSVYLFNDKVECLIFDMDVMRLPSISELYSTSGMTALIDATLKSQADLATTSQLYGDHAFLSFVLTDGAENRSRRSWLDLRETLKNADENWTVGFLVPDRQGQTYLERIGVDNGQIALWDATSAKGLTDAVSSTIRSATDNFMVNRAAGVRGTRSVFSTGRDAVNKSTVRSNLTPLDPTTVRLFNIGQEVRIDDFVNGQLTQGYIKGKSYYLLTKRERIQPQKQLAVMEKKTGKVYTGDVRSLIGLPNDYINVSPDFNPDYEIFVQSTSYNRKLVPGQKLLVLA